MESFEWRNGRKANHLIHLPLVSHGIAMCAGRMNGDTRVTKIIDELYCIVARSGCNVGDDPKQAAEQIQCLTLPIRGLVIIRQDSTPLIQSLLPPFTLLSNVRLGRTDFDGVLMEPRLLVGRSHRC